jgi:hypothetical protein
MAAAPIGVALIRWRVSLITATPAEFIDFTIAPDAQTAEEQVAEVMSCVIPWWQSARIYKPSKRAAQVWSLCRLVAWDRGRQAGQPSRS